MNNRILGIVLEQQDYRNHDVILKVFTKEYGVISFVARGIRTSKSKNASACSLFCESWFYFDFRENNELQSLKIAEKNDFFYRIYESLEKQVIASLLCETIKKCNPESREEAYDLLKKSLHFLNVDENPFCVLGLFMAKMNLLSGIRPQIDCCVRCQHATKIIALSIYDGGFVCPDCFEKQKDQILSIEKLRYFRLFHKASIMDYEVLSKMKHYDYNDVKTILDLFFEYSGIYLRGISFLKQIITIESVE